jgi:hypothetical protein
VIDLLEGGLPAWLPRGPAWAAVRLARRLLAGETGRKLLAFERFQQGPARLGADGLPLAGQVAAARALPPQHVPWVIEGLGFAHAEAALRAGEPAGLLSPERAGGLGDGGLLALHMGMGLAFARRALAGDAAGSPAPLDGALARFARLCRDNARPGYEEASFEALGLVARLLHPALLAPLDRCLAGDPARAACLWHGAGRGLYFLPRHTLSLPARAGELARREGPHRLARLNLLAGLAWAVTLVNLGRPRALANLLRRLAGEADEGEAVSGGASAACVVWHDLAPGDRRLAAFLAYRPGDHRVAALWETRVAAPCRAALAERRRPGELFYFRLSEPMTGGA